MSLLLWILAAAMVAVVLAIVIVKFIPLKLRWLVSLALLGVTIFLAFKIYGGIMEPINFAKEKKVRYAKVIKNLKDIRDAEVKYKEVYGTYTNSKDSLIKFIENGKLALTETKNVEEEVDRGGGIKIKVSRKQVDTIGYEPVMKYFENVDYKNMFNVPGTDKQFTLATGTVEKVAGLFVPVFEVKTALTDLYMGLSTDNEGYDMTEFLAIGSMEEPTTNGNWND